MFDVSEGKRLAARKVVFQGDEFGQLKEEVGRVVHGLLNTANGDVVKASGHSSDPLARQNGMEDWNDDDHSKASDNTRDNGKKHKKKGDPLDGVDGMEDW
jgi:hypothetical protein